MHDDLREQLEDKIRLLSDSIWERRIANSALQEWLAQFGGDVGSDAGEQLHALYLLSHFLYFGQSELRCLLRSLYRDMIRAPIVHEIRRAYGDILDPTVIGQEYEIRRSRMRFLAVGNPAESGMHLLYYFRQENSLPKDMFINAYDIFTRGSSDQASALAVRDRAIENYIFIDDLCGSGSQAETYSERVLGPLKALAPATKASYYVLLPRRAGLRTYVRIRCSMWSNAFLS